MTNRNDGGPAFPVSLDNAWCPGMSLRDWFAGQALAALSGSGDGPYFGTIKEPFDPWPWLATEAYRAADAMLAERAKP